MVLIATLAVAALWAGVPAAASGALVHRWPGDGDATDVVGTAGGTPSGGLVFGPALFGQGFLFDGVDDEVSFPATLPPGTGDFTIAFAIRTSMAPSVAAAVLAKRPVCNATQSFWDIRMGGGGHLGIEIYSDNGTNYGGGGVLINDGVFHTVVITRAGTTVSFYVDGGPAQSTVNVGTANVTNMAPIQAGIGPCVAAFPNGDGTVRLAGVLDDIRYADAADPNLLLPPEPVALTAPVIPAGADVGAVVTCTDGSWRYNPSGFTRQWLRDGAAIDGATGPTYTLTAADAGRSIVCRVTAANAGGSTASDSNALSVVALPPAAPAPVIPPPATMPITASSALPAPTRVAVERIATLPPAKVCVSRRAFPIRLRGVKASKIVSAQIKLNGKHVRSVKGKALGLPINLRGLPKGRFVVEIVTTDAAGKRLVGRRAYRTCVAKRR